MRVYEEHMADSINEEKHQKVVDIASNTLARITMVLGSLNEEEKRYTLKIRENLHMMMQLDGMVESVANNVRKKRCM